MKTWLTNFALFFLLVACSAADNSEPTRGTVQKFFPDGTWSDAPFKYSNLDRASSYERRYGDDLTAMNESPLWVRQKSEFYGPVVRLLVRPAEYRSSMIIISKDKDGHFGYVYKKLAGTPDDWPGRLKWTREGDIDFATENKITKILAQIDPFSGNLASEYPDREAMCMDGTDTVLEFVRQNEYVAIRRDECELRGDDPETKLINKLINTLKSLSGVR